MGLIFDYDNVYLDTKSDYDLNKINEKQYLKKLFYELKKVLNEEFTSFDFYILFSHDPAVIPASFEVTKKNKILLWFSDETGAFPSHLTGNYAVILKCYVKKEDGNVYSNPLGVVNEFTDHSNLIAERKDTAVFFSGNFNKNRIDLYRLLFFRKFKSLPFSKILPNLALNIIFRYLKVNNLSESNNVFLFSTKFKSGLGYKKYFDYLLHSKYILCPRGFKSSETFRHIEALHCGCIIISEPMPDVSIYDNNPFLIYKDTADLNEILNKVANNEYDESSLIESHKAFYKDKLEVKVIASRIAEICRTHKDDL